MKNKLLYIMLMTATAIFAQVGVGTTTPDASAILDVVSTSKAFLPPRMTQVQMNAINGGAPANGSILYCSDCEPIGFYGYANGNWLTLGASASVSQNCNLNGFAGTIVKDVLLSGASFSVTLKNNSLSSAAIAFSSTDLVLSGASGGITVGSPTGSPALGGGGTITLAGGQSVVVTYPLTGTPTASGTLTATWTKVSLTCTRSKIITADAVFSNVSCAGTSGGSNFFASVATSNQTQGITVTVSVPGIYNIAATSNGITYSKSGIFTTTGAQTISLVATGTPTAAGVFTYNLNTTPSCSFEKRTYYEYLTNATCYTNFVGQYPYTGTVDGQVITVSTSNIEASTHNVGVQCTSFSNPIVGSYNSRLFGSGTVGTISFSKSVTNYTMRMFHLNASEGQEGFTVSATLNGNSVPVLITPYGGCAVNLVVTTSGNEATVRDYYGTGEDAMHLVINSTGPYDTLTVTKVGSTSSGFHWISMLCALKVFP